MRIVIFILLSFFPISLYSQYINFEISDISFFVNDEIELERTRELRDWNLGNEVTLSLYPDTDIIELEGLEILLDIISISEPSKNIITLYKTGYFGNTYKEVRESESRVYNNLGPVIEFQTTTIFSIEKSILRKIIGGQLTSKRVPSEPYIRDGKTIKYLEYRIKLERTY